MLGYPDSSSPTGRRRPLIAVAATRVRHAVCGGKLPKMFAPLREQLLRDATANAGVIATHPKQMRGMLALRRDMPRYAWGE